MHAKLGVGSGMWEVTTGCEAGGMEGARPRRPWAVAGARHRKVACNSIG